MNMNKALQNLYHAVSNETTTKVNISKLLVDIHYAITGKESANKNNWSKIVNSMADNWPEGGGGGTTVEALSVTQNGTYTAPSGKAYSPVTVNVSGGNVNTYEIINGTAAAPFGSLNISDLITALEDKQATAYLSADASAIGAGTITARLGTEDNKLYASGASIDGSSASCYQVVWDSNGTLAKYYIAVGNNITNAMQYASYVVTEITVVWHPITIL